MIAGMTFCLGLGLSLLPERSGPFVLSLVFFADADCQHVDSRLSRGVSEKSLAPSHRQGNARHSSLVISVSHYSHGNPSLLAGSVLLRIEPRDNRE
jgi:hypothetical protein